MSVKIRLTTTGKTHQISFRLVATDTRSKRDGKFIEILGYFNPNTKLGENFRIKRERYDYWIKNGAQPSPTVAQIIKLAGTGNHVDLPKRPRKVRKTDEATTAQPVVQSTEVQSTEEKKEDTKQTEPVKEKPEGEITTTE